MSFTKGATLLLRDSLPAPEPLPSFDSPFDPSTPVLPEDQHVAITNHKLPVYERVGSFLFSFAAGSFFQNNNLILIPLTEYLPSKHKHNLRDLFRRLDWPRSSKPEPGPGGRIEPDSPHTPCRCVLRLRPIRNHPLTAFRESRGSGDLPGQYHRGEEECGDEWARREDGVVVWEGGRYLWRIAGEGV
jgi:hypothetical protein